MMLTHRQIPFFSSRQILSTLAAGLLALACLHAAAANPPSRPVLFVHGFCGNDKDFGPLLAAIYPKLNKTSYPSMDMYSVQYSARSGQVTFFGSDGSTVAESAIPSNTRFFSMAFYDPVGESTDSGGVSNVSILNKGYELSRAIAHIAAITHIKDVIVVAHSMGGLDARAYLENMASAGECYDYQAKVPNYLLKTCAPGAGDAGFAGDLGDLITIDTPHAGTPIDTLDLSVFAAALGQCLAGHSVNRAEMNPSADGGPGLVETLNYDGTEQAGSKPTVNPAPIQAVEDYFSDISDAWDDLNGKFGGYSDDVVQLTSQSIAGNLPAVQSKAKLTDVPVSYLSSQAEVTGVGACWISTPLGSYPMLHPMICLGELQDTQDAVAQQVNANFKGVLTHIAVNATLNGKPWAGALAFNLTGPAGSKKGTAVPVNIADLALGSYKVAWVSGGPAGSKAPTVTASPSAALRRGQWSATFTLAFKFTPPILTTGAASSITTTGATLKGTINPEGQAGIAFFEWSTDALLAKPRILCSGGVVKNCAAVVANKLAQPVSAKVTTAPRKTLIYYRLAFYDSAKKANFYGKIASFTTKN